MKLFPSVSISFAFLELLVFWFLSSYEHRIVLIRSSCHCFGY